MLYKEFDLRSDDIKEEMKIEKSNRSKLLYYYKF